MLIVPQDGNLATVPLVCLGNPGKSFRYCALSSEEGSRVALELKDFVDSMQARSAIMAARARNKNMDWLFLLLAIVSEIIGTLCFKGASDSGNQVFYIGVAIGYALAVWLFGLCLRTIEVGIAYAVWSGIGIVGTSTLGILLFQERTSISKLLYMILIVVSVIGLNLTD